jgi:hypothetical protein
VLYFFGRRTLARRRVDSRLKSLLRDTLSIFYLICHIL